MGVIMYECKLCGKNVKLLKNHLRNTHKGLSEKEYFLSFPDEERKYKEFRKSLSQEFKECSPNSIHFYIKKGYSEEEATKMLEEKRKTHVFNTGKDFRPNQKNYWVKKGYSEEEAIEKVSLFCSRSLESYIIKYGKDIGTNKYEEFKNSLINRKETEIKNLIEKGYSDNEAEEEYHRWRRESSPRRVEYWVSKGYKEEDAKFMVSKYQDTFSLRSIMERYDCDLEDAFSIQQRFVDKMIETMVRNGITVEPHKWEDFYQYKISCWRYTRRTWVNYKHILNPDNKKRTRVDLYEDAYHLDHKFSLLEGFKNNIDPKIIGSRYNLELIPAKENTQKQANCSITKEELMEAYSREN